MENPKIRTDYSAIEDISTDLLVAGMFENEALSGELKRLDSALNSEIASALKKKEFMAKQKELLLISTLGKIKPKKVLVIGLGEKREFDNEVLRRVSGVAAKKARELRVDSFATLLQNSAGIVTVGERTTAVAESSLLSLYLFDRFVTDKSRLKKKVKEIIMAGCSQKDKKIIEKAIADSVIRAEAVRYVRELVNLPAAIATPEYMVREAKRIASSDKRIKASVFARKDLERMGMNGVLAVGSGSSKEPYVAVLEYKGGSRSPGKVAVVGKGITFDSGGLDIKPPQFMTIMKDDMAGAAIVLGLIKALSSSDYKGEVIGLFAVCENMPGCSAYKPGDIITTFSKKTVEVLNTDAEGRIILADILAYAETLKPDMIIDAATLTGACMIALGYEAIGMWSTDDSMAGMMEKAGEITGERVWRMPLWKDHFEYVRSEVADVRNTGNVPYGREAGAITAAAFLKSFVKSSRWLHLDLTNAYHPLERDYIPIGASGTGLRLLLEFLAQLEK